MSRLPFSSPGENISDSASIKLYNADTEGDMACFFYIYDRKSLFNPLLHLHCWAALSWHKQLQHMVDLELLFSAVTLLACYTPGQGAIFTVVYQIACFPLCAAFTNCVVQPSQ